MSVKMRQIVEKEIAEAIVKALLAAGYTISVDNGDNNGEEFELAESTDQEAIIKALFQCDEDRIYVSKDGGKTLDGWAYLVYGNDGWDVLSDYTVNLEPFIGSHTPTEVSKIIDKYSD